MRKSRRRPLQLSTARFGRDRVAGALVSFGGVMALGQLRCLLFADVQMLPITASVRKVAGMR